MGWSAALRTGAFEWEGATVNVSRAVEWEQATGEGVTVGAGKVWPWCGAHGTTTLGTRH